MATSTQSSKSFNRVPPEVRERMIAEAAYYLAEKRGFNNSEEDRHQDWLAAEREIDARLQGPSISE